MSYCILVVDDHPVNLKLACDVLQSGGFRVERASDAERAFEIVHQNSIDLILMDVALPGMDGLTLTRMLKSDTKTGHIPIVALTAFAMKGDDVKAMEAGCDGYIPKPINTRKLPEQVMEVLNRRSLPLVPEL